jgi:plasmid stabilization system protein ParE
VLKAPMAAHNLLIVPDEYLAQKGLKFALIKNYLLFYIIGGDEKTVTVIRFLYGRRDWKNMLRTARW